MSTNKNITSYLAVGTIVTLKNNCLYKEEYLNHPVTIAANQDFIQPLMVISEVNIKKYSKFDENTGEFLEDPKGKYSYKCIYFSQKSFRFEENYFQSNEIVAFTSANSSSTKNEAPSTFKFGDVVNFKTNKFELLKIRSSLNVQHRSNNSSSNLVTFSSPAFIFSGYVPVDKKEPEFDKDDSTLKIKAYPSQIVKIKAFNQNGDKFSEFKVPIEAIEKTPVVSDRTLSTWINAINSNSIAIKSNGKNKKSIIQPLNIYTHSGMYFLNYRDLISNASESIMLFNISLNSIKNYEQCFDFEVPYTEDKKYVDVSSFISSKQIGDDTGTSQLNNEILYISYRNRYGNITTRFIQINEIIDITKGKKVANAKSKNETQQDTNDKTFLLSAYCFYKKEIRHFNSERIFKINTLSVEFEKIIRNKK